MSYRALILALLLGTLYIDVDPLMVKCGIGKEVDTILIY